MGNMDSMGRTPLPPLQLYLLSAPEYNPEHNQRHAPIHADACPTTRTTGAKAWLSRFQPMGASPTHLDVPG